MQTRPATVNGEPKARSGGGVVRELPACDDAKGHSLIAGITRPDQRNNPSNTAKFRDSSIIGDSTAYRMWQANVSNPLSPRMLQGGGV